jgi:hypothetical protein
MFKAEIDERKFSHLLREKKLNNKEFFYKLIEKYGFTFRYSNFMELVKNNINWRLSYALAICEMLEVEIPELFVLKGDVK